MKHEDFVTFEQAQLLKELDFYWSCDMFYATQSYCEGNNPYYFDTICTGDLISSPRMKEDENDGWIEDDEWCVAAPTLSQAQKWLREIKNIDVIVTTHYNKPKERVFDITVYNINNIDNDENDIFISNFPTYEEALSKGIDEAIKMLKIS